MARMARAEVFALDEVAVVHVMNRVVRRWSKNRRVGAFSLASWRRDRVFLKLVRTRFFSVTCHCFGVFAEAVLFVFEVSAGDTRLIK
jgi:predicted small integral membrane protein